MRKWQSVGLRGLVAALTFVALTTTALALNNKICSTFPISDANRLAGCKSAGACVAETGATQCGILGSTVYSYVATKYTLYQYKYCTPLEGSNCPSTGKQNCMKVERHDDPNCGNYFPCWHYVVVDGC